MIIIIRKTDNISFLLSFLEKVNILVSGLFSGHEMLGRHCVLNQKCSLGKNNQ